MKPVLIYRDVSKGYEDGDGKRWVLNNFSLEVQSGEIVAVSGPSGSGKSTLLNLGAGIVVPDKGDVLASLGTASVSLGQLPEDGRAQWRKQSVGYVFQFFNLIPTLTIRENILLPLELADKPELQANALARLQTLGIAELTDRFPTSLSGGEQQRVAIARALAHEPQIVFADEPTGNLDQANASVVIEMLCQLVKATNTPMVIASHDPAVVVRADRVVQLGS